MREEYSAGEDPEDMPKFGIDQAALRLKRSVCRLRDRDAGPQTPANQQGGRGGNLRYSLASAQLPLNLIHEKIRGPHARQPSQAQAVW